MTKLPIYEALISSEDDGIVTISLVDEPAVESDFVCFAKDTGKQLFALKDSAEHLITGCLMKAETPIYRNDGGFQYYIVFSKKTIQTMAQKMLADSAFKNIDTQHNGKLLPQGALTLMEVYIKDSAKGIEPNFVDIPDGSLMTTFKVNSDDIWNECLNGDFLNGFSLEGFFDTKQIDFSIIKPNKTNSFKMRIKELLRRMLAQFGEVSMDELTLYYEGDGELEVGTVVTDIDGNPIADGEYHNAEMTVTVMGGKVDAIEHIEKKDEPVEEPAKDEELEEPVGSDVVVEEPVVDEPETVEEVVEDVVDIEKELADLRSMIEELKKIVDELVAEPVAKPIEEEFSKSFMSDIADKKVQRAVEIAKALHSKI